MYEHEQKAHTTSRLQQHTTRVGALPQSHLDSVAHGWVPARTPTVHRCPTGKAVGGPTQPPRRRPQTNDNKTPTSLKTNVLSGNKCRPTVVNSLGSDALSIHVGICTVAFPSSPAAVEVILMTRHSEGMCCRFAGLPSEWSTQRHVFRTRLPGSHRGVFDDTSATLFEALVIRYWRHLPLIKLVNCSFPVCHASRGPFKPCLWFIKLCRWCVGGRGSVPHGATLRGSLNCRMN